MLDAVCTLGGGGCGNIVLFTVSQYIFSVIGVLITFVYTYLKKFFKIFQFLYIID
jgi:hypothetical protein